jgi:hypothetical protein
VPVQSSFDYAIVRAVPRVDREEFVNAGVILYCRARDFLAARVAIDAVRLRTLFPHVDADAVLAHLDSLVRIAAGDASAGPIARLPPAERFHWLVAPRSTVLQVSPVHAGLCTEPVEAMEHLLDQMVRVRPEQS